MKKRFQKVFAILLLIGVIMGNASIAMADTGQTVSFSYYTYGGLGSVDGSANGAFYYLTPGNASLYVASKGGPGTINVSLRRSVLGIDPEYGTVYVNGTGWYQYSNIDTSSSSYYLYAWGGVAENWESVDGSMHDHSIP